MGSTTKRICSALKRTY